MYYSRHGTGVFLSVVTFHPFSFAFAGERKKYELRYVSLCYVDETLNEFFTELDLCCTSTHC